VRFIDAERVHSACAYPALVEALERLHREETEALDDLLIGQPAESGAEDNLLLRAAWQRGRAIGVKLATVFPDNPARDAALPAVQALYVLFDGRDGRPLAAIEGTSLTYRKTAADSALGSRYLSRPESATLLMVGAGALAPHLVRAHRAVRPGLGRARIWNRTGERARALAATLASEGIEAEVSDDLEQAVRSADIICCATMSKTPLVRGEWLRPGTHLDLVGAFKPDMREADDEAVRRACVFADCRATTVERTGEIAIPIARGVIGADEVLADLYDLARGRHPGRLSGEEITLYKNGGGGHLDLMTARFVAGET